MGSISLFDPSLLTRPDALPKHLQLRPLERTDQEKGYDTILQALVPDQPVLDPATFIKTFDGMARQDPKIYYTIVLVSSDAHRQNVSSSSSSTGTSTTEVTSDDKRRHERVIASATLLVEHKFLRMGSLAGHIEDVVVDPAHQGQNLGRVLIDALSDLARRLGCYKVVLDCSHANVKFYEKCGYEAKGVEMKKYL